MAISNKAKGFICGALGAASYGTNPIFAIPLYHDGMDTISVLFFRYLLAIPMITALIVLKKNSISPGRKNIFGTIAMGALMALSSLALFISYNYMGAGIASTLLFLYPIIVAVIMTLFFHEKSNLVTFTSILIAIIGIGLISIEPGGTFLSVMGTVAVMLSALSYAIYLVYINVSDLRNVPSITVTFYVLISGIFLFGAILLFKGHITFPVHGIHWLNILGLAFFPTALSFYLTTKSISLIGSTATAILGALEPLTAVFLGIVILKESITVRIACGFILVIAAVVLIVIRKDIVALISRVSHLGKTVDS